MNSLILVIATLGVILLTGCATTTPVTPVPAPYQDAADALDVLIIMLSRP